MSDRSAMCYCGDKDLGDHTVGICEAIRHGNRFRKNPFKTFDIDKSGHLAQNKK